MFYLVWLWIFTVSFSNTFGELMWCFQRFLFQMVVFWKSVQGGASPSFGASRSPSPMLSSVPPALWSWNRGRSRCFGCSWADSPGNAGWRWLPSETARDGRHTQEVRKHSDTHKAWTLQTLKNDDDQMYDANIYSRKWLKYVHTQGYMYLLRRYKRWDYTSI